MDTSLILRSKAVQKPYQLFHFYFLSEKPYGSTLADLSFETDVRISINKFKNHNWTWNEALHYGFLSSIIAFVFLIFPASFLFKIPILLAFGTCFLVPLTSQFFVNALPIFTWLAFFFSAGKIPNSWKPAISVKVLPAMETILYGDNLSNVLAEYNTTFLDILATIPYGLIHFTSPFVVAAFIFIFGPPTSLRSFGFAFGYMNLTGVLIQLLFPAAPPWYKNLHGLEPADYSMSGSPGGLGRVDELLGIDLYTSNFSNSPVVFGAFPSLHSGCAVMDVLFLCWLFPKYKYVWWGYACYLWWSTMYLTHHYFIDLIGGAVLSIAVFTYTKYEHLPIVDENKFCRWSYTSINKINITGSDPLNKGYIGAADLESGMFNSFNNVELNTLTRSRQASRAQIDTLDPNSYRSSAKSTSSLSLALPNTHIQEEEEDLHQSFGEETETDNSTNNSVFEHEADTHQISSTASSTSLDDLDHQSRSSKKGFKNR